MEQEVTDDEFMEICTQLMHVYDAARHVVSVLHQVPSRSDLVDLVQEMVAGANLLVNGCERLLKDSVSDSAQVRASVVCIMHVQGPVLMSSMADLTKLVDTVTKSFELESS